MARCELGSAAKKRPRPWPKNIHSDGFENPDPDEKNSNFPKKIWKIWLIQPAENKNSFENDWEIYPAAPRVWTSDLRVRAW